MAIHATSPAVEDALRAPSVHNTQPWRWRIASDTVELHADWTRQLIATDPDRRDLLLSCGAALHHLQVALAFQGVAVTVDRLPDPENAAHLATVAVTAAAPDPLAGALYASIARRQTDRRRLSRRPVPDRYLKELAAHAGRAGSVLIPVTREAKRRLLDTLTEAAHDQLLEPGYASELRQWTQRYPGGHDGVPATNVARMPLGVTDTAPLRRFTRAGLAQPPIQPGSGPGDDAAELLVLATRGDDVVYRLRAGEACSAVLLAATRLGLATTPLSQATEVDTSRARIRTDVLRIPENPQLLVRVGWPATGATEIPATPRRPLATVLLPG